MNRAKKFYETVFKVEFTEIPNPTNENLEMWQFPANMDEWGASGTLVKMEGFVSGGNITIIYFGCADCAVEESRVVSAGGSIQKSKMSIGQYGLIFPFNQQAELSIYPLESI
jgi:predicted enzyme related to lactoylglutathione lyase